VPRICRLTVAKPTIRATTEPTSVDPSGRRFGSPQSVHVMFWAAARTKGMGSVGPAVPYPEYSITVGHGALALHVEP